MEVYPILWLTQGNLESAEVRRVYTASNPLEELTCLFSLAGDIEMNQGPRSQCRMCKNIAGRLTNLLNVRNAVRAFKHHVQILLKMNFWNYKQEMNVGIAPAAKLTVVYAVVLIYTVIKQSNVTNVKCGFTMTVLSSQSLSLNL